ncbi:PAS domain-containing sensor histidine kinase [Saccharicrinis sp. GN24d3]|uniref:PAS domain-containing sensor histidine kinase n=1 Tax=Saccharicrinis sp. GN24d3 TaxID=3458416 RepID=UPI0040373F74
MYDLKTSKEELILELQKLQKENRVLKTKYEKDVLEQKQITEVLELKEEQRKAILQSTLNGFWRADMQGRLLEVNKAYCQMSGYSEQELLNMRISDLDALENTEDTLAHLQRMRENGGERFESKHRRKDGSIIDVEVSTNHLDLNGGQIVSFTNDITERKHSVNVLFESEQLFREVMQNSPIGMALVKPDGHFINVNKAFCNMLGYSKEELLSLDSQSITHPEDLDSGLNHVRQLWNGGIGKFQTEKRYIRKDETVIWAMLNLSMVSYDDGRPKYAIAQIQDITPRKLSEQALKESETKYRLIADNMGNVVTVLDMDLNLTYVSPSVERILGYSPDEYLKIGLSGIIHPESMEKIVPVFEERKQMVLSGEADVKNIVLEAQFLKKNGALIWVEIVSSFIRDKNQIPVGILSVSHDITERKNNKLQLINRIRIEEIFKDISYQFVRGSYLETDELINSALDKVGLFTQVDRIHVCRYENNGTVVSNTHEWCNEGIEPQINHLQQLPAVLFQWGMDKLYRYELINYEDIAYLPREAAAERNILQKFGIASILAIPLIYEKQFNGFVAFSSVKRKKAWIDDDIKMLNVLSDLISGELGRTNSMKELIKAREKAEESDRLKTSFLANMSHEIRTPMNGILGLTNMLLQPGLDTEDRESFIQVVHQSGQRLLNTVNDIVEISQIESGTVYLKVDDTDVNACVEGLMGLYGPEARKKGLKLMVDRLLPVTAKNISTDRTKLDSMLGNLIKNAIKYTESGTINMGCLANGAAIEFYIKDTGIGIPKERQAAVFERFVQADNTDTRAFEGLGVGLAIARSYAQLLGGNIRVESEEGVGSTFYVNLPVKN